MEVAIVGGGISGLVAAHELLKGGATVTLYKKDDYIGGHIAEKVNVNHLDLDLDFFLFHHVTNSNMMEFFETFGVDTETSDMSFSVSLNHGHGYEWGSRNGFSSLFAQKKNVLNPYFWQMIREIIKFKDDVISYLEDLNNNPDIDRSETLGQFVKSHGYSELFQKAYLIPICASICSWSSEGVMEFSAHSVLSFCRTHHLLQVLGPSKWLTVKGRSHTYLRKVEDELEKRGCKIRSGCEVTAISTHNEGCVLKCDGSDEIYNACIVAAHAPDALKMLGDQVTHDELRILGAFQYHDCDIFLHRDESFMPRNLTAWSAWNFLGLVDNEVCLTYWLNTIQNMEDTDMPYLVTLNPPYTPQHTLFKWSTSHPVPSIAASKASSQIHHIQGKRGIWFCGAYQGYGFHEVEDGWKAGKIAAGNLLMKSCPVLENPKHMVPSWLETGARVLVTRFFKSFITTGCIILVEEGGTIFTFQGMDKTCSLKVIMRVHSPRFYWKVATEADLGLADAFINGEISFVDRSKGLLNLFMIFITCRDLKASISRSRRYRRGWWTPFLPTAGLASAKYFFRHIARQNTMTQARRNISRHYDLCNELFSLILHETMSYSCAIFKTELEDLTTAQMRKNSLLIEKAKISKEHHVLEIGCGWGGLAIELVKRTGCKYTGITLSEEQLRYAESKVKEAGLQDRITILLCDYRQILDTTKYDRIISCEMIESIGHEFIGKFFNCCELALVEDGILVLQFISIPDERYDEHRNTSDFMREYIFQGGGLFSLSKVTSAMAASSRLCVQHVENIGIHYYPTLRCWRTNFLENQSKILALGFDEKFIRTWEYYFDYAAAGFKTCTALDYQVVFCRSGNVEEFGNLDKGIPSVY